MSLRDVIIDSMARTLWVDAWACEIEERSQQGDEAAWTQTRGWAQRDLMDLAPETPQAAKTLASKLAFELESDGPCFLEDGFAKALYTDFLTRHVPGDTLATVEAYAALFGHYLAMEALGHGVAWSDDHEDHVFDMPIYFTNFDLRSEVKL